MEGTKRRYCYEKNYDFWYIGQIGKKLVVKCREIYGTDNVLATDIREPEADSPVQNGPFEILDVTDRDRMLR